MKSYQPLKPALILLAVSLAWLLAACSPQAPEPTPEEALPHLTALTNAVSSGSKEYLLALVQFSSFPCSKDEGAGGAPQCLSSEAEGTLVEALPILGPAGHHLRRADFSAWAGIEPAQLYAAYRNSESAYSGEFFPAGEYSVAFILPDGTNGVVFQITQDGIIRIDYLAKVAIDNALRENEVIFGPYPQVK